MALPSQLLLDFRVVETGSTLILDLGGQYTPAVPQRIFNERKKVWTWVYYVWSVSARDPFLSNCGWPSSKDKKDYWKNKITLRECPYCSIIGCRSAKERWYTITTSIRLRLQLKREITNDTDGHNCRLWYIINFADFLQAWSRYNVGVDFYAVLERALPRFVRRAK